MWKREIEVYQQLASLKEKELDFKELHNKCKKIEQNVKEQQKNKRLPTSTQESSSKRKFLNSSFFFRPELTKADWF
ncbi:hypothetical protein OUZ56_002703 [Daphnia magna]|uniref:Uncharacterized protein n=1 Tax=Daphnia magna TaxID=35525 RepID=A0ABR0A6W6_9CRUS|nr:hypothetical protein OUZ56_002703 [Daphnia magna]